MSYENTANTAVQTYVQVNNILLPAAIGLRALAQPICHFAHLPLTFQTVGLDRMLLSKESFLWICNLYLDLYFDRQTMDRYVTLLLQGVSKKSVHFCFCNFLAPK